MDYILRKGIGYLSSHKTEIIGMIVCMGNVAPLPHVGCIGTIHAEGVGWTCRS